MTKYRPMAQLKTPQRLREALAAHGIDLPFDETVEAGGALAQPIRLADGFVLGNRFCIHPMEGWDGTPDGLPSDLTRRRWVNFGRSGAKLIWGGEAVAVEHAGRANPNQLMITPHTLPHLIDLRRGLAEAHSADYGGEGLLVGVQLTHSGRYARPDGKFTAAPRILYRHPILDKRVGVTDDSAILSDGEIEAIIERFIAAAVLAQQAGFDFVDVKHCHGYLGHEFLSAITRPGKYGGSFENRTRFLREITAGIRAAAPGLRIGVRLSMFDLVPFYKTDAAMGEVGAPDLSAMEAFRFGGDMQDALGIDLREPAQFLAVCRDLGIGMVNLTAGSPYYNPHIQRPAYFPPSDGYQPPEDPLVGVARQVNAAAMLKAQFPDLLLVGTGYSYLQEWLAPVAQAAVRRGMIDCVGVGRMVLSYPTYPADVLAGRAPDRKKLCRTFSDCTTAPRQGRVSGCYPLDALYKEMDKSA